MTTILRGTEQGTGEPARGEFVKKVTGASGSRAQGMLALNGLSVLLGLATWWAVAALGVQIPTPAETLSRGLEMAQDGTLLEDAIASLTRVFGGFVIGVGLAIPVGFLMGWYWPMRALIEPWVQFFRTIPPLALIPIMIVLLGIGEAPKVFLIFIASFLVSVISTYQGVVSVDRTLINAARVLGSRDTGIFLRVVVPASTPFILVGMRVGLGSAWATLVAAELVAAQAGLGYRMKAAQLYSDEATIFVGIIAIGILGLLMDRALLMAEKKLTGWQESR
jgi:NitT/TauT family transport system permease protein